MMLAALLFVWLAGQVDLTLAPDQPLPQVYIDEPLVVGLEAQQEGLASIQLRFDQPGKAPVEFALDPLRVQPGAPVWTVVEAAPAKRGWYKVHATIMLHGAIEEQAFPLVRVDRPLANAGAGVAVHLPGTDIRPVLQAAVGIGLREIRFDADSPDIHRLMAQMREENMAVVLRLNADNIAFPEDLANRLATSYGSAIKRWDLQSQSGLDALEPVIRSLRESGHSNVIAVRAKSPQDLARLLRKRALPIDMAVVDEEAAVSGPAEAFRTVAEMSGREAFPLVALCHIETGHAPADPLHTVRRLVRDPGFGAAQTLLSSDLLFEDGGFAPGYPLAGAYLRQTRSMHYAYPVQFEGPVEAHLFRRADQWLLVLWRNEPGAVEIPARTSQGIRAYDANGNPTKLPPREPGSFINVQADGSPLYLAGRGGALLPFAAAQAARREAQWLMQMYPVAERLPSDLIQLVASIAEENIDPKKERERFLALVRALPYLERRWHSGSLPSSVAVPAIASIARMLRALCVIEQQRGEPFLEPLQDTLAFCSHQQALYLTQSTAPPEGRARGDWLMSEVKRLTGQARELDMAERTIEAAAVASLAEWRARALGVVGQETPSAAEIVTGDFDVPGLNVPVIEPPPPIPAPPETNEAPLEGSPPASDDAPAPSETSTEPSSVEDDTTADGPPAEPATVYRVESGDTPWGIAHEHGISLDELFEWNGWREGKTLSIGEEYIVSPPER